MGAKVALVEQHLMGGDCTNVGCVPSKCMIRSARASAQVRKAGEFGVQVPDGVAVDFDFVMERVRRLRAQISKNESVERFTEMGVDVFLGEGRFLDGRTIETDDDQSFDTPQAASKASRELQIVLRRTIANAVIVVPYRSKS